LADETTQNHAGFIWSVADLLRGVYKQHDYGQVILPLTVLRRLDCVLEPTKTKVLETASKLPPTLENRDPVLEQAAGQSFFNTSKHTFATLLADPDNMAGNLRNYIAGFSESARDIITKFDFDKQIKRLAEHNLLYLVVAKFADVDLLPETVSNLEMGYLYEELVRKFSELSNETAGEHFTPREVIRLMVNLLLVDDDELLTKPGIVKTIFDPACGTGGMLSVAEDYLRQLNPHARLEVFGQELNDETYATCRADMLIKGEDASNIRYGNSFDKDQHPNAQFDYILANPPFGVEWKMVADTVRNEHETQGFAGRFGAGLPRIDDGQLLFLQHMISKMKNPSRGGSRVAVILNGSPLFTGAAGSGESEIRRWIIENDWLETVVALPDQLFYNTGISTYIWIVTNRKPPQRCGKVQLIDARNHFIKMSKSLGKKSKEISATQIDEITHLYGAFEENENSKIFPNETFGQLRITVEQALKVKWRITHDAFTKLEKSKPWKNWIKTAGPPSDVTTPVDIYGRNGKLPHFDRTWDTAEEMGAALTENHGGGVPIEIINQLIKNSMVSDPDGILQTNKKGEPKPDPNLRDNENVAAPPGTVVYEADPTARLETIEYQTAISNYLETEVHPYLPDAWHDPTKTKIGYDIPLNRHFYTYTPPRPLQEIDNEIKTLEKQIQKLLEEFTE